MKHSLIIERYQPDANVYTEIVRTVLSGNDIIYPDLYSQTNRALNQANGITFLVNSSPIKQADGWTYFNCAAKPTVTYPVVVLPQNDELQPTPVTVPDSFELRVKVVKEF